ncbi:hypothetical protein [Mesorhizobium sp. M2A.F.Ca.ET.067.02.1.1]|uniref:hypothetical protein n=1 Tax=Mesorhizobium sp. M2A.F.Ca.ET.067.02.1.1 TaxID=2496749 RepID=UPI000FD54929|nr:hypothetical protein [Mesorhizobium sp. M2A.F.Ca.ET.067.02.1.1]RUW79624.1 hypothetical protein EOA28_07455 [Mesorhizobium sp. M2A.F.Ca.ET.067.02.1.1]
MAQAYGSKDHPVNLGPFRRIVEVHWGPETHFAFLWTPRGRSTMISAPEGCDPPDYGAPFTGYPTLPPPGGSYIWLERTEYYLPDGEPQGIADMVVRRNNQWHGLKDTPVITGLPTLPGPTTHGEWEQSWLPVGGTTVVTDTDGMTQHAEHDLAASFRPDSGTDTDIDVPNAPGFFQTGFTPTFGFSSPAFTSGPVCYTDGFFQTYLRLYAYPAWIDTVPVPVAGIEVTYKKHVFKGVAARRLETVHSGETISLGCWILCERQKTS